MLIEKLFTILAVAPKSCEKSFLSLIPWYHYLPANDFGINTGTINNACDINSNFKILGGGSSDILLILAAIVDDLLRIAGIVALGFVIVGAIKFVASQGSPDATASAQGTVINALIGLAISITGIAFINFIGTNVK